MVTRSSHHSRDPMLFPLAGSQIPSLVLGPQFVAGENIESSPPHSPLPAPLRLLGWIHLVTHVIPDCP
jgi:hypothetical protein